mmetsp:Transcript_23198/g.56438  ORF Transcript_23198/g.56438 Transcript_23198/m.56438 type:complete len:211 (-) Transcript_23198:175-807(-)
MPSPALRHCRQPPTQTAALGRHKAPRLARCPHGRQLSRSTIAITALQTAFARSAARLPSAAPGTILAGPRHPAAPRDGASGSLGPARRQGMAARVAQIAVIQASRSPGPVHRIQWDVLLPRITKSVSLSPGFASTVDIFQCSVVLAVSCVGKVSRHSPLSTIHLLLHFFRCLLCFIIQPDLTVPHMDHRQNGHFTHRSEQVGQTQCVQGK